MDTLPFIISSLCLIILTCETKNIYVKNTSNKLELNEHSNYKERNGYISPYEQYFPHLHSDAELLSLNRVVRATGNKKKIARYVTTYSVRTVTTGAPQKLLRSLCEKPRGRFRHPYDCHKYLDCWDGRVLEQSCPAGTAYSDLPGGFCDYLEYVDCGGRYTTTTTTTTPPPLLEENDENSVSDDFEDVVSAQFELPVGSFPQLEDSMFTEEPQTNKTSTTEQPTTTLPTTMQTIDKDEEPVEQFQIVNTQIKAPGIVKIGSNSYVFVIAERVNWETSRERCRSLGDNWDLLSIESKKENNNIKRYTTLLEVNATQTVPFYTSGTNIGETNNTYYWSAIDEDLSYTAWDVDEPDLKYEDREGCIQIRNAKWSVVSCLAKRYYICEYYTE